MHLAYKFNPSSAILYIGALEVKLRQTLFFSLHELKLNEGPFIFCINYPVIFALFLTPI